MEEKTIEEIEQVDSKGSGFSFGRLLVILLGISLMLGVVYFLFVGNGQDDNIVIEEPGFAEEYEEESGYVGEFEVEGGYVGEFEEDEFVDDIEGTDIDDGYTEDEVGM